MTTPHATDREQEALDAGLSPDDARLLAADAARADHGTAREQRQRLSFEAWGQQAAAKSRPWREQRDAERSERQQLIDEQRAKRIYERDLQKALDAIPLRYADAQPSHPDVRQWTLDVRAGARTSLLLMGTVGTGKTHQAFGAFHELAIAGVGRCIAITVPALLDALRPGRPGEVDYAAVECCDLLLLDDFAAERVTDWTAEVLYRLIDARYSNRRRTIITTNATPADVRDRLGDRIASRLAEMCRTVVMTGTDRRLGHRD